MCPEDASLDEAIHQLIMGHHQSLLVTRGEKIVGVLRLTDVFAAVFHTMKECFEIIALLYLKNDSAKIGTIFQDRGGRG